MANSPNYAASAAAGVAVISTANTARDGTGTIGTVVTAGASGSRFDGITIQAAGTTTAGMVRIFLHDGSSSKLLMEVPVPAITPSGTITAFNAGYNFSNAPEIFPIIVPTGYSIRAATNNAETFNVFGFGGNF
jgi:hypothetical protein